MGKWCRAKSSVILSDGERQGCLTVDSAEPESKDLADLNAERSRSDEFSSPTERLAVLAWRRACFATVRRRKNREVLQLGLAIASGKRKSRARLAQDDGVKARIAVPQPGRIIRARVRS